MLTKRSSLSCPPDQASGPELPFSRRIRVLVKANSTAVVFAVSGCSDSGQPIPAWHLPSGQWLKACISAIFGPMRRVGEILFSALVVLTLSEALNARPPPIRDPVLMRIGVICRWENECIGLQLRAMSAALNYVQRKSPPRARLRACNRNAARGRDRVDWIGFNNCIRNKRMGR